VGPSSETFVETPAHHPALADVACWEGEVPTGFSVDFLGVKTRVKFTEDMIPGGVEERRPYFSQSPLPPFDEEYFEWIDVIEAVKAARDEFVMIELGAGYGRWLARAVAALGRLNPLPFRLVAVEAEPTHFEWLQEHLRDNGVDPKEQNLIEAAVNATGEAVKFYAGNPSGWYGQAIARASPVHRLWRVFLWARAMLGWRPRIGEQDGGTIRVPGITLESILRRLPRVDLIDLDVQGAELDVLGACIERLDAQVKRIHIGTHSADIESGLREVFAGRGWQLVNDYPCQASSVTPYGEIEFGDGVQTWINPRI
jgi:FkbM family methyltransferase